LEQRPGPSLQQGESGTVIDFPAALATQRFGTVESGKEPKEKNATAAQKQTDGFQKKHGTVADRNKKNEFLLKALGWGGRRGSGGGVRAGRDPSLH